jgi:hypothetical protein
MMQPQPVQFPGNMPLTVTLEAAMWQGVMTVLLETPGLPLPVRAVNSITQAITEQLQQQAQQPVEPPLVSPEHRVMPTANGLDHDPVKLEPEGPTSRMGD